MILYRIDRDRWESRDRFDMKALDEMLDDGVLVPVELEVVTALVPARLTVNPITERKVKS